MGLLSLTLNPKKKSSYFLGLGFKRFVLKTMFGSYLASSMLNTNSEKVHNFPPSSLSLQSCWRKVAKAERIFLELSRSNHITGYLSEKVYHNDNLALVVVSRQRET